MKYFWHIFATLSLCLFVVSQYFLYENYQGIKYSIPESSGTFRKVNLLDNTEIITVPTNKITFCGDTLITALSPDNIRTNFYNRYGTGNSEKDRKAFMQYVESIYSQCEKNLTDMSEYILLAVKNIDKNKQTTTIALESIQLLTLRASVNEAIMKLKKFKNEVEFNIQQETMSELFSGTKKASE